MNPYPIFIPSLIGLNMLLQLLFKTIFVVLCPFIIFLVLLQKGKGGTGLFSSMTSTRLKLFGASGGQDIFQRVTWICGGLMMALAIFISILNKNEYNLPALNYTPKAPVELPDTPTAPSIPA